VHDAFDERIVGDGTVDFDSEPLVMTTWHAEEPLADAIWFALRCAEPDGSLAEGCGSVLVLEIGDHSERTRTIAEALSDPQAFVSRLGREDA
jgi:hypothetical protein